MYESITPSTFNGLPPVEAVSSASKPSLTYPQIVQKLTTSWGWTQNYLKWTQPTVTFSIGVGANNGVSGYGESAGLQSMTAIQKSAANLSFKLWNNLISGTQLVLSQNSTANITLNYSSKTSGGGSYSQSSLQYTSDPKVYKIAADQIWLASQWSTNADAGMALGGYGLLTMIHEIGHALGLSHAGVYNAGSGGSITFNGNAEFQQDNRGLTVMSYFGGYYPAANAWMQDGTYTNYWYPQTPMVADILAIQSLYGVNTTTRTSNTVYGYNCSLASTDTEKAIYDFSLNSRPIFTIYDANGSDTLDCSGFSGAQVIDLTPGNYSSVRGMVNNVAIAFGTFIETALGGSGNDSLIANNSGNVLDGRAGNDTLTGGTGADTLKGGLGTNTVTGGAGLDNFQVTGTDTITDLGNGNINEILIVSSGAVATVTLTGPWTATTSTQNLGTVQIRANGFNANVASASTLLSNSKGFTLNNTGGANAVTLTGSALADTLTGGRTGDVLVGGGGSDTFQVTTGTQSISDLANDGLNEVVTVATGAVANATLSATWTPNASTVNNGTANITSNGYAVNLSAINSGRGFNVTNTGVAATLTGSPFNDTLRGWSGADTLVGGLGTNTLTGGTGLDTFKVTGTDTITDLGNGDAKEVLQVSTNGVADVYLSGPWTATASTLNQGATTIHARGNNVNLAFANTTTAGARGYNIWDDSGTTSVTLVGSGGNDWLYATHALDVLTGGGGSDIFDVAPGLGIAGTMATSPVKITDFKVGVAGDVLIAENVRLLGHSLHVYNSAVATGWSLSKGFVSKPGSTVNAFFSMVKALPFAAESVIGYTDGTNDYLYLMTEGSQANSTLVQLVGVNSTALSTTVQTNAILIG